MRYVLRGQGALQASVGSRTVLKHEGGNPPPPPLSPPPPSATVTAATTHSHAFGGVTYHMPDGFPGAQHGESGCPAHATLLSPKAPPPPPPSPKAPPPPPSPKAPPPPPPPAAAAAAQSPADHRPDHRHPVDAHDLAGRVQVVHRVARGTGPHPTVADAPLPAARLQLAICHLHSGAAGVDRGQRRLARGQDRAGVRRRQRRARAHQHARHRRRHVLRAVRGLRADLCRRAAWHRRAAAAAPAALAAVAVVATPATPAATQPSTAATAHRNRDGRVLQRTKRWLHAQWDPAAKHQLRCWLWRGEAAVHAELRVSRNRRGPVSGPVVGTADAVRASRTGHAASERKQPHRALQQRLPGLLAAHTTTALALALALARRRHRRHHNHHHRRRRPRRRHHLRPQ